jgi:hypothetical protein
VAVNEEARAYALLARALLAQRRLDEARAAAAGAEAVKTERLWTRLTVTLAAARVRAASEVPSEADAAVLELEAARAEAQRCSFYGLELEARLALGRIDLERGRMQAGRERLLALAQEARSSGHGLIAREAAPLARPGLPPGERF